MQNAGEIAKNVSILTSSVGALAAILGSSTDLITRVLDLITRVLELIEKILDRLGKDSEPVNRQHNQVTPRRVSHIKKMLFAFGVAALILGISGVVYFMHSDQSADRAMCGGDTGTPTPASSPTVSVTFDEYAVTAFGTNLCIYGDTPGLGNWSRTAARRLSSDGYPVWSTMLTLPANTPIEYKYFKVDSSGNVQTVESIPNRKITTPATDMTYKNSWNVADTDATDLTFKVTATPPKDTTLYVVGSICALGNGKAADAIPLSAPRSAEDPVWSKLVIVPKSTTFSYKYIEKDSGGHVTGESDTRSYTTRTSTGYTTKDTWKGGQAGLGQAVQCP